MKILFSPLGMTDPISHNTLQEGSLLNICRFYQPDKIYLYMSKEVLEYHKSDNRYILCLEHLYKYLNKEFEYEIIERGDLEEVQIFDFFYKEYRELLNDIHMKYPEGEILLNASSGTPAMKNALFVLCTLSDFAMKPIQVSTPLKKSNTSEKRIDLQNPVEDYFDIIDMILSEPEKFQDRTTIATKENLNFELRKDIIKNHINNYNYAAAKDVAEMVKNFLPEKSYYLILAAFYRNNLDREKVTKYLKLAEDNFDYYETAQLRLIEYVLYLSVNIKRNMLLEFIRGISPALDYLFQMGFEKETGIRLDKYLKEKDGKVTWKKSCLESDEDGNKILRVLNKSYYNFNFGNSASSDKFLSLMKSKEFGIEDSSVTKKADELRKIEYEGRNKAAHQIISIDDEFLKRNTGYRSKEIIDKIIQFIHAIDLGVKQEHWNSYEYMNEKIIRSLND